MAQPVLVVASLVLLVFTLFAWRRSIRVARLIRTLRTLTNTTIAESKPGELQRVHGTLSTPKPITSPFQKRSVAYFAYRIEAPQEPPKKPRRLAVGKDWADLVLEDETGVARVESRPAYIRSPHEHVTEFKGLQAVPPEHKEFFEAAGMGDKHVRRFPVIRVVEYTLEPGDEVYVTGDVRTESSGKVFYRARHSPLVVSKQADAGLVPGYRNELLLFSVAATLLASFAALFFVVSLA